MIKEEFFKKNELEQNKFINSLSDLEKKELLQSFSNYELRQFFLNNLQERKEYLSYLNDERKNYVLSSLKNHYYLHIVDNKTIEHIKQFQDNIKSMHPKDIAKYLEEMTEDKRNHFYKLFNIEQLSDIFGEFEEDDAAIYITELSQEKASDVLENLDVDDAVDIINELEQDDKEQYLNLMDEEAKQELTELAKYSDDEAGSIMDTNFILLDGMMDVKEAMKILLQKAKEVENINPLFVSLDHKFIGVLDFKKLIVTKSPCLVKDITNENCKRVEVDDTVEKVVSIVNDYDIYSLPVLKNGQIEGIITIDDAFRALHETREEEYNQLAGLSGEHESEESIFSKLKRRISWLLILCILDIFVCLVISSFENMINKATILVLFQPIVLGLAGNVGTQSLAICVRNISSQLIQTKKQKIIYILKELRNGISLGFFLGIGSFIVVYLYLLISSKDNNPIWMISLIVAVSIFLSMSLSSLFGSLMPIFFNMIHIDPTAASGPLITTLNDMIAIATYFLLATILLL